VRVSGLRLLYRPNAKRTENEASVTGHYISACELRAISVQHLSKRGTKP
jgi:hypothetical protein